MKKLIILIASFAIAGSASAVLIVSQDFNGTETGTSGWAYNANIDTSGGLAATTTPGTPGTAVGTLSAVNSGTTFWVSYHFTMAAHSQYVGDNKNNFGLGSQFSGGSDLIGFDVNGNPNYGDYHLSALGTQDTAVAIDHTQGADLFVMGLFQYAGNGGTPGLTAYISAVDYANRATLTESDVMNGFSVTATSVRQYGIDEVNYSIAQKDGGVSTPTTLDDLKVGTTYNDVQAIPEPATLGLVTAFGGAILLVRRRLMI